MPHDPARPVGFESRKAYARRCREGFWDRWIAGPKVVDIGYMGGLPDAASIVPGAIGLETGHVRQDEDTPPDMVADYAGKGYDGFRLPFDDFTVDTVHSSHVLEHLTGAALFLREWFRVLRVGGTMILFVPHAFLYERRLTVPPSRWSPEHLTAVSPSSLLRLVEDALAPNSYRVAHMADADDGYDYSLPLTAHPTGSLEIELVLRRISPPEWEVEP